MNAGVIRVGVLLNSSHKPNTISTLWVKTRTPGRSTIHVVFCGICSASSILLFILVKVKENLKKMCFFNLLNS